MLQEDGLWTLAVALHNKAYEYFRQISGSFLQFWQRVPVLSVRCGQAESLIIISSKALKEEAELASQATAFVPDHLDAFDSATWDSYKSPYRALYSRE